LCGVAILCYPRGTSCGGVVTDAASPKKQNETKTAG